MSERDMTDRLCFIRQGENGMEVEIVGNAEVLHSMISSALMSHAELRKLFMPIMLSLMADDNFKELCLNDIIGDIGNSLGINLDDDDDPITTD